VADRPVSQSTVGATGVSRYYRRRTGNSRAAGSKGTY
jgi:hypothetical protein